MQRLSTPLSVALLALLCVWQAALPLAFFLRLAELPRPALGGLARGAVPLYTAAGALLWIAAHEMAHAAAARCCGVRGGGVEWSPPLPAFYAPPQPALDRSDTRFLICIAGPMLDLLLSLALAAAAVLAPTGSATVLRSLFVISLLAGMPNCCVLAGSDMDQGMHAFGQLCGSRWPSRLYGVLSACYAATVILMVVQLVLHSRPGIV